MDRVRNLVTAVLAFFSFTVPSIFWISYFCFPAATKQVIHHEDLTTNVGGYSSSLASSRSIGDYRYPLKTDFKWTSSRNATAITKSLLKRDPVYDKYANDGRCFIFELIYGVYPASDFTNFNQIEESGWEEEDDDDESSSALDQLQGMLHTTHWEQVDFWPYHWVYKQPWLAQTNPGQRTFAEYKLWANRVSNVVVVEKAFAPIGDMDPPGAADPNPNRLRRLSDYTFLVWQDACRSDHTCIQSLEWVIHDDVINSACEAVARYALQLEGVTSLSAWPGTMFQTNTASGQALVGCPNGFGVAYMLGQNIIPFTPKTIDYVLVFADDFQSLSLAYHIASYDPQMAPALAPER